MVERDLAKVEVASSSLVSRSIFIRQKLNGKRQTSVVFAFTFLLLPFYFPRGRRSQVVRQSSAKALFIGSIPIAASKNNPYFNFIGPRRSWNRRGLLIVQAFRGCLFFGIFNDAGPAEA